MSFTWRMEVKDETFTNLRDHPSVGQDYITPDAGVASLDDFSVDGAGNCLEARFRASPKFVDIRARDIVSLEVSEDNGSTWTPVYRGYVVTAGNPRSDDIQEYKLVGLRQRFFEITNPMVNVLQNDAADQAEAVFQDIDDNSNWPAGVTQSVPALPDFNFVNGIRHPQKESYGDTLKAIAESVGRFVVPVGETYTYDGKTYNELETVPAARFGVDASGNVIFARPQSTDAVFSETGDNILAEYTQVTGEEIFDVIELEYISALEDDAEGFNVYDLLDGVVLYRLDADNATPMPLRRKFVFGNSNARRVVSVESPVSLMSSDLEVVDAGGATNPTGAITGGSTTLASDSVVYGSTVSTTDGFIFDFDVKSTGTPTSCELYFGGFTSNTGERSLQAGNLVPVTTFRRYRFFVVPASDPVEGLDLSSNTFIGTSKEFDTLDSIVNITGQNVEIRNVSIYIPDVDFGGTKSNQFASGFVRDVQQDVAEVTLVNQFGPVAPRMVWTPEGESPVTVPVERIQYTLTTNDGLITQYELGQAFDAELLSERAVLKGLAREAVSE